MKILQKIFLVFSIYAFTSADVSKGMLHSLSSSLSTKNDPVQQAENAMQELERIANDIENITKRARTFIDEIKDEKITPSDNQDDIQKKFLFPSVTSKEVINTYINKAVTYKQNQHFRQNLEERQEKARAKIALARTTRDSTLVKLKEIKQLLAKKQSLDLNTQKSASFGLPNLTPSRRVHNGTIYHTLSNVPMYVEKTINKINSYCEEVRLPNGSSIFFPANGVQPTIAEAVQYSCAKIEANKLDSEITLYANNGLGYWSKFCYGGFARF
jgi:chromosome segregation ATPase